MNELEKEKKISRLLALCLAQNMGNVAETPLKRSINVLNEDVFSSKHKLLLNYGNEIYNDAIDIIEASFNRTIVKDSESRTQPRISLSSIIKINFPDSDKTISAKLDNISWGGAQIKTSQFIGAENEHVILTIPYTPEHNIHIEAIIVRYWESDNNFHSALRFTKLHYKDELRFNKLLEMFFESKDSENGDHHTQFSHHINISYLDMDEIKNKLDEISNGKMNVVMPDPIDTGKSICVNIEGPDDNIELNLRAYVIDQEEVFLAGFPMYRMKLQFNHPINEVKAIFNNLIIKILERDKQNKLKHENDIRSAKKLLGG
ncbi:MAG: PilZ domain-containing protein [Gammaproteobacteria bacterium]|nr:PilZ domain-containing protein [Gammaproteobacteria bacterium]